jgi:hypothetical protein
MTTPSARDLEAQFLPLPPRELPHDALLAVREHSKRMFGNQDRLEVAVGITRVELGKVNATDLHRDIDVAVNRIRTQLLALDSLALVSKTGNEDGKRMFMQVDRNDRFWKFAVAEYEMVIRDYLGPSSSGDVTEAPPPRHPPHPVRPRH